MKQAVSLIMVTVMILMLGACGKDKMGESVAISESYNENIDELDTSETVAAEGIEEPSEPTPEPTPEITIDWVEYTSTFTTDGGYVLDISVKMSPWILLSNTETINSAWMEVSNGNALPGFDDWGLRSGNGSYYFRNNFTFGSSFNATLTDMYYCMGTLTIQNKTEGWSIDSSNSQSLISLISPSDYRQDVIGKVFYSNGAQDSGDYARVDANIKSDTWGPCTFVIMTGEEFTPNNPEGAHYEELVNSCFPVVWGEGTVSVGVIGKQANS